MNQNIAALVEIWNRLSPEDRRIAVAEAARQEEAYSAGGDGEEVGILDLLGDRAGRFFSAAQAHLPIPKVDYLINGDWRISPSSVNVLVGPSGVGKTLILESAGICVSSGKRFLGCETKRGAVLYLDEENGRARIIARLARINAGTPFEPDIPFFVIHQGGWDLRDPADFALLASIISCLHIKMVIVDSLADILRGDENSKADTHPVLAGIRRIAELTGAAFIIIHHTLKDGGNYRGSSAIVAAVDSMVKVEKAGDKLAFTYIKNRDGDCGKFFAKPIWTEDAFRLEPVDSQSADQYSGTESAILRFLEDKTGAVPLRAIYDHLAVTLGRKKSAVDQAMRSLRESGKIYRTNPEVAGKNPDGSTVEALYAIRA